VIGRGQALRPETGIGPPLRDAGDGVAKALDRLLVPTTVAVAAGIGYIAQRGGRATDDALFLDAASDLAARRLGEVFARPELQVGPAYLAFVAAVERAAAALDISARLLLACSASITIALAVITLMRHALPARDRSHAVWGAVAATVARRAAAPSGTLPLAALPFRQVSRPAGRVPHALRSSYLRRPAIPPRAPPTR